MNVMIVSAEIKKIDLIAYVVKDKLSKEYFHLEDCVALFQRKQSAEDFINDDNVVSLHTIKTSAEIVKIKLTTNIESDDELVYVALNEDNSIVADEDFFLYVYHNLHDLMLYDRERFVVAQIIEK